MKPLIIIAAVLLVMIASACGSSGGSAGATSTATGAGSTGSPATGPSGTGGTGGSSGGSTVPPDTVNLVFEDYHMHGGQYSTAVTFHFRIANHNSAGVSVPAVPWVLRDQHGTTLLSGSTPPLTASSGVDVLENYTVQPGLQTYFVVIDPDSTIPETNTSDNSAEIISNAPAQEITVVPEANELTWYDAHIHNYGDGNLVFHMQMENIGTNNLPIANVPWEVVRDDGVVVVSGTIHSLAPGPQAAQDDGTETSYHETEGEHTYTWIIDPNDTISGDGKADDSMQTIVVIQPNGQA